MSGEYPGRVARDFVNNVCFFLEGRFGFRVHENCYEGRNAASVAVNGRRIKFDLIVVQNQIEQARSQGTITRRVIFFCECKWRTNPKYLKGELKKFLKKAIETAPEIQGRHSDNFGFIFICNWTFGVKQENLQDIEYLRNLLGSEHSTSDLNSLSRKVGLLVLSDWFLELVSKGGA